MKKQQLNKKLYDLHLNIANAWGNSWHYIQDTIEAKLNKLISVKYEGLETNLRKLTQKQTRTPSTQHNVYPRVINKTNITFTNNEPTLLNKGLKYNLHRKNENWLTNLALEAETAINLIPITDRDYYRKQLSNHITQLQCHKRNKNLKFTHNSHMEWTTMKTITAKLKKNNAIVTSADKGNTIVILPSTMCQEKIQNFIDKKNFRTSNTNPTQTSQKQIRKIINSSPKLINSNAKWKYINLNPSAPTITGLVKLHKSNLSIRAQLV
jgi:hypothetical protein